VWRLRGRYGEREELDRLLETVRSGRSGALVVRGEAGMGKTALLDYLVEQASGFHVVRTAGVESEMELAFAGLHQLAGPMLDRADRLPEPQRDALHTAFGLVRGAAPDRFLVGLAALGLLAEAAREQPLLCVVDDTHWLDAASAQVLAFVARRLVAESVAIVFATRVSDRPAEPPAAGEPERRSELAGLTELVVGGLADDDARALLDTALRGPVDEEVRDRIIAEARGNPLALLELPRELTPAALAAGFGPLCGPALPRRIEESFRRQLARLEPETRRLLLAAAAEPIGDSALVWRAAERLGLRIDPGAPLQTGGLLEIDSRVRFRHPLVRSAVLHAATAEEQRSVHRALAEVTDPETDPDRRAWHAAQAAAGPDEEVAGDLERSAGRAQARGGMAAAAAFLERAAHLTPEPCRRAQRLLAAAHALHQSGAPDAALRLLPLAEAGPLDKLQRARVDLLRARIALTVNRGREAPPLLLKAARQLEPLDARLARETYLDAFLAAMFAGSFAAGGGVREVAEAAIVAPPALRPAGPADKLLDGLAVRFTAGYAAGLPPLRRALAAFRNPHLSTDELGWLWLARITAGNMWDEETLVTTHHVQLARETGALTTLPLALAVCIGAHVLSGELAGAASLVDELEAVTEATGSPLPPYGALLLAAWQGNEAEAATLFDAATAEAVRRGEGFGLTVAMCAQAVLHNSFTRYEEALAAARAGAEQPPTMAVEVWGLLSETVEAAVRCGNAAQATDAFRRLAETTRASGTDWALGIEARCRAQLSDGETAESAFREAIERLGRTQVRGEYARAHLLYGEWLRRRRRRFDAREQLRTAHEMFIGMGMRAWAKRAAEELVATGESVRKRSVETGTELTPKEAQIVHLISQGLSNPEIAQRLFLSRRTVEWHIGRIFGKLGVTSRRQLRHRPGS